jgi:D-alanyl-D-alanine carboxypeptidase
VPLNRRNLASATVLFSVLISGCGGEDERAARISRPNVEPVLEQVRSEGAPGVVALVRNRAGTWRRAMGAATLEPRRAMRVGDRLRVASVTKTFVATVVLQLVGEGRVSLDDRVEQRLPGVLRTARGATVRQFLNHTSGLAGFPDGATFQRFREDLRLDLPARTAVDVATSNPELFEPGAGWSYTNAGYEVLGLLVERVTGQPLGRVLAERIFKPLRLRQTSFEPDPGHPNGIANGHAIPGSDYLEWSATEPLDVTVAVGAGAGASGAIVSTVEDVARFYHALFSGELLPPELLREMFRTVPTGATPGSNQQGLGIFRYQRACGFAWGHGGVAAGYTTSVMASRDGTHIVAIAANGHNPHIEDAVFAAAEKLYCHS